MCHTELSRCLLALQTIVWIYCRIVGKKISSDMVKIVFKYISIDMVKMFLNLFRLTLEDTTWNTFYLFVLRSCVVVSFTALVFSQLLDFCFRSRIWNCTYFAAGSLGWRPQQRRIQQFGRADHRPHRFLCAGRISFDEAQKAASCTVDQLTKRQHCEKRVRLES